MRYVIFSRVSGNLQIDESQLFACRDYVYARKKEGDEVIEFNEPPTSTRLTMDKRPVLQSLFEFLQRGDHLVVACLSRLARTGTEVVKIYEDQITKKNVILHSLLQPKVDKNFIHIYAMMGEIARDIISKNTKDGLRSKQAQLQKVGSTWYGYKTDDEKLQPRENVKSTNKPYLLVPKEDEQRQVSLMVEMYKKGCSFGQIERELESRGYKNREGNPVYKTSVHRILTRLGIHSPTPKDVPLKRFQRYTPPS